MGSEEELSCPVFDLLKQGEEEEEGPLYENLALNSPALSLPPPVQVHYFIAIFFPLVQRCCLGGYHVPFHGVAG